MGLSSSGKCRQRSGLLRLVIGSLDLVVVVRIVVLHEISVYLLCHGRRDFDRAGIAS